jgi:transcriptional regulator with XRE-family HTH domain
MTGMQLLEARERRGWTQLQTGASLRVSQPYLSLMEKGLRPVPERVVKRAVEILQLSPETLPVRTSSRQSFDLPRSLAALGYPGFAYLRGKKQNPASLLVFALSQQDLESRVLEALPWLVMHYPQMDWDWLVREAKLNELQNRMGYVTDLAARKTQNAATRLHLVKELSRLDRSRLVREETLCQDSMTQAERAWLSENRPAEAKHWNLLTDLSVEHLAYE